MNAHASMDDQISAVCRSAYAKLHNLRKIKKFVNRETLECLVHAFVSSKLDYCNALYVGIPQNQLARLQRIQNSAARLLVGAGPRQHITPILRELHWLPVLQRITFKILLLVYKAVNNIGPKYLCDLIKPYVPTRRLRSASQGLVHVPSVNSNLIKNSAFSVVGPQLFNSLPLHVRLSPSVDTFKRNVKTHLFEQYFNG